MFVNEYVMTRKRYDKWAVPKFWKLPIFYVYCVIFAAGTFGWIYFHHVGASLRWQSVGATLSFIASTAEYFSNGCMLTKLSV